MDSVIWTPSFCTGYDISILLDRNFAREMIQANFSSERQNQMNKIGNDELKRRDENWLNPYEFYKNSCLVTQINIGHNGVWLSASNYDIARLTSMDNKRDLEYHSHNVRNSKESFVLMSLFGNWMKYADILKK